MQCDDSVVGGYYTALGNKLYSWEAFFISSSCIVHKPVGEMPKGTCLVDTSRSA